MDDKSRRSIRRRFKGRRREQGILFYVPFFFNYILIPFVVFMTFQKYGLEDETYSNIANFSQYFTPVLTVWWIFLAFIKYIDGEGNEIYYVKNRIKLKEVLLFLGIYVVSTIVPFICYSRMFSGMWLEWLRIVVECIVFAAISYCLLFLIQNIAITMIPVIGYAFGSVFLRGEQPSKLLYYGEQKATVEILKDKYLLLLGISVVCFAIGVLANWKKEKY
ncbi:MAG: hypothetical protein PHT76_08675 [Anaerostipes sp.]|nr:hypothetical protein [Anaerostipes sp.]